MPRKNRSARKSKVLLDSDDEMEMENEKEKENQEEIEEDEENPAESSMLDEDRALTDDSYIAPPPPQVIFQVFLDTIIFLPTFLVWKKSLENWLLFSW